MVDSLHPDFLIITGDLVRDALRVPEAEATGYYELFAREKALFRTPVVTVPGNHENFGIERDSSHVSKSNPLYGRAMYHHYFGPDYYSFTRGGIHFVGLNTVDIDDQHYYGHVDSLQLAWLERDLALVPAAMPVVTFDHIPFFTTFEGLNATTTSPSRRRSSPSMERRRFGTPCRTRGRCSRSFANGGMCSRSADTFMGRSGFSTRSTG